MSITYSIADEVAMAIASLHTFRFIRTMCTTAIFCLNIVAAFNGNEIMVFDEARLGRRPPRLAALLADLRAPGEAVGLATTDKLPQAAGGLGPRTATLVAGDAALIILAQFAASPPHPATYLCTPRRAGYNSGYSIDYIPAVDLSPLQQEYSSACGTASLSQICHAATDMPAATSPVVGSR